ncbi:MAG: hypothetical protein WBN22_02085 [Verrucomicrobiia bacterium]
MSNSIAGRIPIQVNKRDAFKSELFSLCMAGKEPAGIANPCPDKTLMFLPDILSDPATEQGTTQNIVHKHGAQDAKPRPSLARRLTPFPY